MSATTLLQGYRERTISPREVTQAVLDRIETVNPPLNAFVTVTADLALTQASAAERDYAAGGNPGPLAGVPYSIKDLTPTKGVRTARGSLLDPDWIPDFDAPIVSRMTEAGGVLLGQDEHAGTRLEGRLRQPRLRSHPQPVAAWIAPPEVRAAGRARPWRQDLVRWPRAATEPGRSASPRPSAASSGSSRRSDWSRSTRPVLSATSLTRPDHAHGARRRPYARRDRR